MTTVRIVVLGAVLALSALALALPASAHRGGGHATIVTVIAGKPSEFGFIISAKTVPLGNVTFNVSDAGQLPHTFKVCATVLTPARMRNLANACTGPATPPVSPGGLLTLRLTFRTKGAYEYLCTLAGHAAYGQKGVLRVT
jgi:hypothetical protein